MITPPLPPFWNEITGNAPVNEYSILGYQMLVLGYAMMIWLIPMIGYFLYGLGKHLNRWMVGSGIKGKFDNNGKEV